VESTVQKITASKDRTKYSLIAAWYWANGLTGEVFPITSAAFHPLTKLGGADEVSVDAHISILVVDGHS
jgi:hypothetical protein